MRILYVAYPLLPVTEDSAGGAEQMLWTLEREIATRGHVTAVAACADSRVAGELVETGDAASENDTFEQRDAEHCASVAECILRRDGKPGAFDFVHDKSGHFWRCASVLNTPVLATLHLPRHMYAPQMFENIAANLYFNCVSDSQAEAFRDLPRFMGVVQNGITIGRFPFQRDKGDYLLWIGRICEEKGPHLAIEVARRAALPLAIAGAVYPFSYHQQFYEREIAPRLAEITYVEWPSFNDKLKLLQNARAVLLTSTVEETSSLVAMEAMACGTPVVAFRRGAFPEIVLDRLTGFVVEDVAGMVAAIGHIDAISAEACRERVEREFSAKRMASDYEVLYDRVVDNARKGSTAAQIPSSAA